MKQKSLFFIIVALLSVTVSTGNGLPDVIIKHIEPTFATKFTNGFSPLTLGYIFAGLSGTLASWITYQKPCFMFFHDRVTFFHHLLRGFSFGYISLPSPHLYVRDVA